MPCNKTTNARADAGIFCDDDARADAGIFVTTMPATLRAFLLRQCPRRCGHFLLLA
jgi:hypothetical protein